MRICTLCRMPKPSEEYYKDDKNKRDGLRSKCIKCLTNGRPPGPSPISIYKRYVENENGCWVWQGSTGRHGYGSVKYKGKTVGAHRVSYILTYGQIPEGLVIDHLCSNKPCINPLHLEAVAHKVNLQRARDLSHCHTCKCGTISYPKTSVGPRKPMVKSQHIDWLLSNHKEDERGCWIWQGGMTNTWYGRIKWENKSTVVHRVIYEHLHGKLNRTQFVDHKCSVRMCVNPDHLEAVTPSTNAQRAWDKTHCVTCACEVKLIKENVNG